MSVPRFVVSYQAQGRARLGQIVTPHGVVQTPAFVPVATQGTVKGLDSQDLAGLGVQVLISNTYHLYLRPRAEIIAHLGGLHRFMGWDGPLMTDSGGFQVFSLGAAIEQGVGKVVDLFADDSREEVAVNQKLEQNQLLDVRSFCKVTDQGVTFISHVDGTWHEWTAEKSMQVQHLLGADLVMAMDECTSPLHDYQYTQASMQRSHDWEERSLAEFDKLQQARAEQGLARQGLYGIVQGGEYQDLREQSAKFVAEHNFFGAAIGGALVSKEIMRKILEWTVPLLPDDRPRHLLGIGGIDDIFVGVRAGIDTFDCAHPTRIARRGHLLIGPESGGNQANNWRLAIRKPEWTDDARPVDQACDCHACQHYSRAYLRHLYWARELTYFRLATIHNLAVMQRLMRQIRQAVAEERLGELEQFWRG